MPISLKSIAARGCLGLAVAAVAACSARPIPALSVNDLMEDRVMLDGVLLKCSQNPAKARTDSDCLNARIAIDRLDNRPDPAAEAKRAQEFERSREQLRLSQERQRQEQEAKTKVDAYHLPLVPVDPAAPPAPVDSEQSPPVARESNP
jgi:uncharacterized protein YaiL (DUF2058 family)